MLLPKINYSNSVFRLLAEKKYPLVVLFSCFFLPFSLPLSLNLCTRCVLMRAYKAFPIMLVEICSVQDGGR